MTLRKRFTLCFSPLLLLFFLPAAHAVNLANPVVAIFGGFAGKEGRFDDFTLEALDGEEIETSVRVISSGSGGYGLSPDLPPGRNFDLLDWYLNTPADDDNNGISDRFSERELASGKTDERYFYTAEDGGMVFRATIGGAKTSKNTLFTRTELREMLRRGNTDIGTRGEGDDPGKNNWVFSSAPEETRKKAGAVDGTLRATLAINHVTTTGDDIDVGQVVIGQIHAAKDEPARLYYQKFPGSRRGSIYVAHEPSGGDDIFVDLLGSKSSTPIDPPDGIALDETFSYEIRAEGNLLTVTIRSAGEIRVRETIDMSNSGYDVADDFMYFKAGVYNQNLSGDPDDYVQATFYVLENIH
jgi:poly(beta-D-mannuronate) lyase